jgi:hypothetical protein
LRCAVGVGQQGGEVAGPHAVQVEHAINYGYKINTYAIITI